MRYQDQLQLIPFQSLSFGYTAIRFCKPDELREAQIGYSIDPDGNTLVTDGEGSWRDNWLVIGYEELCGDPIFIDTLAEGHPVYTAIHGTGRWNPMLIADSIEGFAQGLAVIKGLAKGRENPVELEKNPLGGAERDEALEEIRKNNPGAEMSFWQEWIASE